MQIHSRMLAPELARQDNGLRFAESDIERRKTFVGLQQYDLFRLAEASPVVTAHASEYVAAFFDYLARFEEAAALFARRNLLEEARQLKLDHLGAMVEGEYGKGYVEQMLRLAKLYSEVGLHVRIFLGAYHYLLSSVGSDIVARFADDPLKAFHIFSSFRKIGFFDMAIVIDFLLAERERTIALQQDAIRELATPVLQIREGLLLLPVVGVVDTQRARLLTDGLLREIRSKRAKVVVMDITGVPSINAEVANHLVQAVEAARLIGVVVILSGLSPAVARTLIDLGVEPSAFDIVGDLRGGVERSERLLGYKVVRDHLAA